MLTNHAAIRFTKNGEPTEDASTANKDVKHVLRNLDLADNFAETHYIVINLDTNTFTLYQHGRRMFVWSVLINQNTGRIQQTVNDLTANS